MDIDTDTLGIPDTEYDCCVTMESAEFARIVRDLSVLGESVKVDVSKDGVRFTTEGESANGNVLLKQAEGARSKFKRAGKEKGKKSKVKKEDDGEDEEDAEPESEEEGESLKKKKKTKVKKEEGASDGDVEMVEDDDDEEAKPDDDEDDDEDEDTTSKKRKKGSSKSSKPSKRAKRSDDDDDDDEHEAGVTIDMNQAVNLTFSLKYLVNFSKSTSLSRRVQLMMSADVPLLVAYKFAQGKIHYYLAPKIGDE